MCSLDTLDSIFTSAWANELGEGTELVKTLPPKEIANIILDRAVALTGLFNEQFRNIVFLILISERRLTLHGTFRSVTK